ncbi:MAG TPA: 6-bladed beta-propeller [Longimicrobiaceae bacterium]
MRRREALQTREVARSAESAEFTDLSAVDVDSRGRVYVGDWYQQRVTVLSPGGAVLRTIGRRGEGPGEFRSIRGVQLLSGDSLLVYDPELGRVSVFAPEAAAPAYIVNVGARMAGAAPFQLWRVPGHPAYVALFRGRFAFNGSDNFRDRRDSLLVLAPDGTVRARIGVFPSKSFLVAHNSITPNPFGREVLVQGAPGRRAYVVWNDSARVTGYDLTGRRVGGFAFDPQPARVTPADVQAELAAMDDMSRSTFARVLNDSTPERWPAVRDLLADEAGRLWIGLGGPPSGEVEWAVFTPEGRYLRSVFTAPGTRLRAVRGQTLYVERRSDDGVPHLAIFTTSPTL